MPNNIKIVSIAFGVQPFRRLANLSVQFAERLTLIAGHNGLGKSTILGLTTHHFGLPRTVSHKSYFDVAFHSNIEQMMHIDVSEVDAAQETKAQSPRVTCSVNGVSVVKECSLTRRSQYQRARVVSRTEGKKPIDAGGLVIGPDAKVPLPTIFLGIKRMLPAGEALERDVSSRTDKSFDATDGNLIASFINSVVVGGGAQTQGITSQAIKGARKISKQPGYNHDARAISLGQDSLGSIATALASFNRLKREMGESYPGGLLVIDELDAGLHPHAIARLVSALKTEANRLKLQVIATTHSPRLIEAVHPEGEGNLNAPDSIVYLQDSVHPRLAPDQSLKAILADMNLKPVLTLPPTKTKIPVYFEDEEAAKFFELLVPARKRNAIARLHTAKLELLPLGIGGSNLLKLPKKDPHFLDTVLIVDADTSLPGKLADRANMVKLPGKLDVSGNGMSPERTIKAFLTDLATLTSPEAQLSLGRLKVTNPSTNLILVNFLTDGPTGDSREQMKQWWKKYEQDLVSWGVVESWGLSNQALVDKLTLDFAAAVAHVALRLNSVQSNSH